MAQRRAGTAIFAAFLLTCAPMTAYAAPEAPPVEVAAHPAPDAGFAAPDADLTLRGVQPDQVRGMTVTGSDSGEHDGALTALPNNLGSTFDPSTAFSPGEQVTVSLPAGVSVKNAEAGDYSFTVARPGVPPDPNTLDTAGESAPPRAPEAAQQPPCDPQRQTYVSRPDLGQVPGACTPEPAQGTEDGFLFTSSGAGPTMFDDEGEPVWHAKSGAPQADDFKVVRYLGRDMLAYYQGAPPPDQGGHGEGHYVLLDDQYRKAAEVHAADGYRIDLHELRITPQNTALVGIYAPVIMDLTGIGGSPNTTVYDYVVQEVDIATGAKLFEWHALDHLNIEDSYVPVPPEGRPYDWIHGNSVGLDRDGNLLVSARHTWATYKLDRRTGEVMWTFGGKNSSFDEPTAGAGVPQEEAYPFCWQHDIRVLPDGRYTLFDNGSSGGGRCGPSRGLVFDLEPDTGTATITDVYRHDPDVRDIFAGNMQSLPGGNKLIGWGNVPQATEFQEDGTQALDLYLTNNSYRVVRHPWTGRPLQAPAVAARDDGARAMTVFASWNGSTEVTDWQVVAGERMNTLEPVGGPTPKNGFETQLTVDQPQPVTRVQALDENGNVLHTSPPVFWSPETGAHVVRGEILRRYLALGGLDSPLGFPTTDERTTPDGVGRFNHFAGSDGGSIYWTPETGAHGVWGAIRDRWEALGWELGPMGYPTTDELVPPDGAGRFNHFSRSDGASIYWSPWTGAHEVQGRIRERWAALGWELSYLGYPTTGEFPIPGGRRSDFERGFVEWYAADDRTVDFPY